MICGECRYFQKPKPNSVTSYGACGLPFTPKFKLRPDEWPKYCPFREVKYK